MSTLWKLAKNTILRQEVIMASPVKAIDLNPAPSAISNATKEDVRPPFAHRLKKLLRKIFEGHEEYLGVTPD
jgi:hypothetical protein